MVTIGDGIFCIKKKLSMGSASGEATILARHMMDGTFKRDALLNSTFTGQTGHAQGEAKRNEKVNPLHVEARTAIISEYILQLLVSILCEEV